MSYKENSPCYAISIRRVAKAVTAIYDCELSAAGLTFNHYSLIGSIADLETCTMSELAVYVGLERTTLTRTLRPLIDRGLIVNLAKPGSRSKKLCLSEQGKKKLKEGYPYWEKAQEAIESILGEDNASWICSLSSVM